jgi:membrane protein DedA with SNARE-associated domain
MMPSIGTLAAVPNQLRRRLSRLSVALLVLVVVSAIAAYVALEGDLFEGMINLRSWSTWALNQFGVAASLSLLYVEESGVPMPVPGDIYVAYIGQAAAGSIPALIAGWLGIIAVVTAGATNLYFISRRWGARLVRHRMARAFHVNPERMATASRWFATWGVLAIIVGRHIPGFRVPLTVVAGTIKFPYPKFAISVAVSTSVWAGFYMVLGKAFGNPVITFLSANTWIYAVGTGVLLLVVAYLGIRVVRIARSSDDPEPARSL